MSVAGVGMMVMRKPFSLMQAAAINLVPGKRDPKRTVRILQKVIIVGGILFILFGVYLAVNPVSHHDGGAAARWTRYVA
ncbi:hypothetical protein ACX80W_11410 [Arthrobacter sp. TMN-37]